MMVALVAAALVSLPVPGVAASSAELRRAKGAPPSIALLPQNSGQCIVVTTPSWSASTGTLCAFERGNDGKWRPRGQAVEVRVGNAGLAWGRGLFNGDHLSGPRKIEGDKRAPAGVFKLLFSFGYQLSAPDTRMRYRAVDAATVTVDDPHSRFYNQMLEATSVPHPDWKSAEKMRLPDDRYKWGIVVGHNVPPVPGAGSCIFMHVWKNSATATVGCTAMPERAMVDLLRWMDPAKHPLLIQMPVPVYLEIEGHGKLPALPR
jgi:D-alanyl-D-alanine dipeptidase